MPTDTGPALGLRLAIGALYLSDDPPPGRARAMWLMSVLRRAPHAAVSVAMARDFLAVVELHQRLSTALSHATDAATAAALGALVGHAEAALSAGTAHPGWRAAALDRLDPDGRAEPSLAHDDAVRLLQLALGGGGGSVDDDG